MPPAGLGSSSQASNQDELAVAVMTGLASLTSKTSVGLMVSIGVVSVKCWEHCAFLRWPPGIAGEWGIYTEWGGISVWVKLWKSTEWAKKQSLCFVFGVMYLLHWPILCLIPRTTVTSLMASKNTCCTREKIHKLRVRWQASSSGRRAVLEVRQSIDAVDAGVHWFPVTFDISPHISPLRKGTNV